MKPILALLALAALCTIAHGAPRTVGLVLDAPPNDAEARERALTAAHVVLYGVGAVGDPGAVRVRVLTAAGDSGADAQLGAWLAEAHGWAAGKRGASDDEGALKAALGRLGPDVVHVVIIDPEGGGSLTASAARGAGFDRRTVTVIGDVDPPAGSCAPSGGGGCRFVSMKADLMGAAHAALERALAGLDGVSVTTAADDGFPVQPATVRAVAIARGSRTPGAGGEALVALAGDAPKERLVTARLWRQPTGARQALTVADGRPLVVWVRSRVIVTDCDVVGDEPVRWRFAAVQVPFTDAVAQALEFDISGVAAPVAAGDGVVELPPSVPGRFRLTPMWKGATRDIAGDPVDCSVSAGVVARAGLSARRDGEQIEATVRFTGADGEALPAADVLARGVPDIGFVGGERVTLTPDGDEARARLALPGEGEYTLELPPVASRALALTGGRIVVRVAAGGAGSGAWWPGVLAALLVGGAFVAYPAVIGSMRRKQPIPAGSVSVSVGGSPVIDRRIGPHTAFPTVLVGVRDVPIADGEVLARAEVRWDGLRPTITATIMSRPDSDGRCTPRLESCRLADARPFTFSNVRIEFVEHG